MSIRSRIRSVVLAGTLACSLSVGSLAFATEASSAADAGADSAGLGSAISQIATNPGTPAPSEQGTPSYVTASTGPLTYQVSESWQLSSVGDANQGMLYDIYTSTTGVLQAIAINGSAIGSENDTVQTFLDGVAQSSSMSGVTIDDPDDRTLDGTLIRDVDFEGTVNGVTIDGKVSFVFGTDYTGILASVYADDMGEDDTFNQAHDSLGLTISNATSAAKAGFTTGGTGSAAGTTGTPDATTPATGTTAPSADQNAAAPAAAAGSATVEFEGMTYVVSTDPSTFVRGAVETYEGDPLNGQPVIGVPVTVTNTSDETKSPDGWMVSMYGPSGMEQDDSASYYIEDSLINVGSMRPGASTTAMIYFLDEGAGEYVAVFDNFFGDTQEVNITVQ